MHIILVPGAWLDASAWAAVVPSLVEAGHTVHPMTLPGKESPDADQAGIGLRTHVDAVVARIDELTAEGGRVVLVGHSAGANVITGAADLRAAAVARLVYVDAVLPSDGSIVNDQFPVVGESVPLPAWDLFQAPDLEGLDDAALEDFRARALPEPKGVFFDPISLTHDDARRAIPATVIACETWGDFPGPAAMIDHLLAENSPYTKELATLRDVEIIELPTGHWPMFTRPRELGEVLAASIGRER
ncbi:alpha/beta hydrolase [Myceligenerans crystallogenes]